MPSDGAGAVRARTVVFQTHLAFEFDDVVEAFAARHAEATIVVAEDDGAPPTALANADVLVAGPQPVEVLADAVRLRLHVVPYAGVNRAPLEWYRDRGVLLASSHGNAASVAERAVALLYAAAGRIAEFDRDLRDGRWHRTGDNRRPFDYWRSLSGARVAVLGGGAVGTAVGRLLRPLAGRIVALVRSARHADGNPFDEVTTSIEVALADADAVVVALPLTGATRGLVTAALLATTNHAVVVNVGRAEVVPEEELWRALGDGTVQAAGLDVWYRGPSPWYGEALPANRPFHRLANVVLSPHAASHSVLGKRGQLISAIENVDAWLAGDEPPGLVATGSDW